MNYVNMGYGSLACQNDVSILSIEPIHNKRTDVSQKV